MQDYTFGYIDSNMRRQIQTFKATNDHTAKEYVFNTLLKDKVASAIFLQLGKIGRVCCTCGIGKQVMLTRYFAYYECLDCVKYRCLNRQQNRRLKI